MTEPAYHIPVLLKESLDYLSVRQGGTYVDATLGGGGHSLAIAEALGGKGTLIAIDRDSEAIEAAGRKLKDHAGIVRFVRDNFANMKNILSEMKIASVDGILFDLGVSSRQIDEASRGFSLRAEGPLDMRMSAEQSISARDIVNSFSQKDIAAIIRDYGEERLAARIARAIVSSRDRKPIGTTLDLADVVNGALSNLPPKVKRDCLTRTFQALRIAVNDELDSLKAGLSGSVEALGAGGRIVVISYHSLEDRIVKGFFRDESGLCVCPKEAPVCTCGRESRLKVLTRKPVVPGASETSKNPRARSAKLRAAERT